MGRQFASNEDLFEEVVRLRRENQKLRHRGDIHQRIEAALQERDNRYSLLIESSPDAVILYNPEGKVLYVNPAFERIYGWSRQEWLGRRIDFVPIEEKEVTSRGIKDTLAGHSAEIETRRLTKDGRLLDVQLKTAPCSTATASWPASTSSTATSPRKRPTKRPCAPANSVTGSCSKPRPTPSRSMTPPGW